jgi:hypothetical protein
MVDVVCRRSLRIQIPRNLLEEGLESQQGEKEDAVIPG